MNLYSNKVTITDKRELKPFMRSSNIHVAGSVEPRVIYTNVPKKDLDEFISENVGTRPNLILLGLAIAMAQEVKTVPDLRIADDDTVSIEKTSEADLLMIDKGRNIIIVGVEGKLYTNNVAAAKKCVEDDVENGEFTACLLKALIDMEGLIECEMKVE